MTHKTKLLIALFVIIFSSMACGLFGTQESKTQPTDSPKAEVTLQSTNENANSTSDESKTETSEEDKTNAQTTDTNTNNGAENSSNYENAMVPPPPEEAGACSNPLFPLVPGYQWVYQVTSEGETSKIGLTVSKVEGNKATVNALYYDTGITTETTIECDDGNIINFPVSLLGFLFGDVDGKIEIEHVDGIFLPDYQSFEESLWDTSWTSDYVVSGLITATIEGDEATGRLYESPLHLEWETQTDGEDIFSDISVEAGDYDNAIHIIRKMSLDFKAELEEDGEKMSLDATLYITNSLWYAPNVGLLKQVIDDADIKIYGIRFPAELDGSIELLDFSTTSE